MADGTELSVPRVLSTLETYAGWSNTVDLATDSEPPWLCSKNLKRETEETPSKSCLPPCPIWKRKREECGCEQNGTVPVPLHLEKQGQTRSRLALGAVPVLLPDLALWKAMWLLRDANLQGSPVLSKQGRLINSHAITGSVV